MKTMYVFFVILFFFFLSCKKEAAQFSASADELFWLTNKGADMPVWVKGNTASKIIILFVHGGPGKGAYSYSGFETDQLQKKYAVAYWDQRDAASAAGNSNYDKLTLDQMIDDLEKLVITLKYRYGNDCKIFLLGHSFGGLLGPGYLVKDDNQNNIRGWIEVDGAHDYPEVNVTSRQMLIDTGKSEIAKGNFVDQWTEIVQYCESHQPNVSLDISYKINDYAHNAESYMPINHTTNPIDLTSPSSPVSYVINLYHLYDTEKGKDFLETLEPVSYTSQLSKIKIPTLLIWGQYDFVVPQFSGTHALQLLGSSYKKMVLMPHSGHTPMNGDTDLFASTVINFVETVK
jgi:pimeloyl-ACP methyl ester carboxylesterase